MFKLTYRSYQLLHIKLIYDVADSCILGNYRLLEIVRIFSIFTVVVES